jgi:hypothetical protein
MLGEAYAFGVVWSFATKGLAVVVLRFTEPDVQRWRVPLNFRIRGIEVPLGLTLITVTLFLLAGINVLTKKTATISGTTFTLVFFAAFTIFERRRQAEKRKDKGRARSVIEEGEMERFRLEVRENLGPASLQVRPGNILVPVHDPDSLSHLQKVLDEFDPEKLDVIVLSVNVDAAEQSRDLALQAEQVVDNYETVVFSRVVHLAEKAGKPVSLVAMTGKEPYPLILQAAEKLRSFCIVVGLSSVVSASQQEREVNLAWEQLPAPRPTATLEIVGGNHQAPIQIHLGSPVSRQ